MNVRFVNMTPHAVNWIDQSGVSWVFPPSGEVARIAATTERCGTLNVTNFDVRVPLSSTVFGESNVPDPEEGVTLIVSRMVVAAHPEREDLVFPNEIVRNEAGQVVGCRSFSRD